MAGPGKTEPRWPRAAASAAIFRAGEVLLVKRSKGGPLQGLWSLPGGCIEPGESMRTAALREVREETGVTAGLAGLLDVHEVIHHGPAGQVAFHYLIAVFYGRWLAGEPLAGDDAAKARFVPLDAVGGLQMTDGAADFIRRAWALLQER